ncbi:MAG: type II toxin-antitoxin system RelE/ParE family toxin [Melioribacteraceae bacterium]|nr:type II toxin-antitoxin system RelE/ParE family toxin [Melioribacteraceae bacterium]MCF8395316.1 type II toxin-antitoxin system RelE/ParE family toxin [Melioribacteraceae bacterium]MCF8420338.1 type II toxin-antitoxin system RelE/ParE family toxin [Melioribacteraceae bacterium]
MKVIWSPLAVERLEDIYDYIAQDNITAASDLTENIFTKVESLLENPNMGRVVPESNRENIRELFEGEYRIIYRVEKSYISVLTIRNFKQLLPDTDIE